jgi:class 3 adenylate cyclase
VIGSESKKTKKNGNPTQLQYFSTAVSACFNRIRSILLYYVISTILFFVCPLAYATDNQQTSSTLSLHPNKNLYELGPYTEMLSDSTTKLTIDEVSSRSMSTEFKPVKSKNLNLGLSESAFWFRFSIRKPIGINPDKKWFLSIDRRGLTQCELFFPIHSADKLEERNQWRLMDANEYRAEQKSIIPRMIVFPLPPLIDQPSVIYLRIHNPDGGLYLSFKLSTEQIIIDSIAKKTLWLGIYFGTMIAMLFLNFFLYLYLRETVQLTYIFYIISVCLYFVFINGITDKYISNEILVDRLTIAALGLTLFWGTGFAKFFLNTKKYVGFLDKILITMMIASAGVLLVTPFASLIFLNQATSLLGITSPFLMVLSGLICWRRGFRPIFFFLFAWSILCVGGITYGLTYRGTLPYTTLTFYSFQISSCLEIIILSFALGDRMRRLRSERDSIRQTFGKYVSDGVCDSILSGEIPLDGEEKEVTVIISDLRDYTPLVEATPPKDLVKITNIYMEAMVEAIQKNRGIIIRFVGDSIQAVFGAPLPLNDHPGCAVKAALDMRSELIRVNDRLQKRGIKKLSHGIGIHTGKVTAANIGSPERLSYSLTGMTVNIAARLENLTKKYHTDIIVSRTTVDLIKNDLRVNSLGSEVLRGLREPVEILKVM